KCLHGEKRPDIGTSDASRLEHAANRPLFGTVAGRCSATRARSRYAVHCLDAAKQRIAASASRPSGEASTISGAARAENRTTHQRVEHDLPTGGVCVVCATPPVGKSAAPQPKPCRGRERRPVRGN